MTKSRNDFIGYDIISSMESNWVTELGTLRCIGEEITLLYIIMIYYIEEVLMLNWLDSIDQDSE